jgi:hypothetical protein
VLGDGMCLSEAEIRVDGDVSFGAERGPDPADPQVADVIDDLDTRHDCLGQVREIGIDGPMPFYALVSAAGD